MSRIDDLIAEMCPDGVDVRALGDVGTFLRGNGLQKKDLQSEGVGAIHYGQVFTTYGTSTYETKSFVSPELSIRLRRAKPGDLVIATTSENDEDVCKAVAWMGEEEIAVSGDAFVYSHQLDPRFVAYFFQTESFQAQKRRFISGTKVKRVSGTDLARIQIPVPPLEVQRDIVSILDKMEKLQAELQAELQARSRQYEFYRDHLLDYRESAAPRIPLGEITSSIASGKNKLRLVEGAYPVYGSTGPLGYTDAAPYSGNALLVARVGANAGRVNAVSGNFDVSDNTLIVQPMPDWDFRFAFHQLVHMNINQYAVGGGQPLVTGRLLKGLEVALPPRKEQRRIATLLDKFDSLVTDLSVGLPAEITARRQQYEYYRDKLLTFPERSDAA